MKRSAVRGALAVPALGAACLLSTACGHGGAAPRVAATRTGPRIDLETPATRVVGGPEKCWNARDDDGNGLIDEGCGLPTGAVQFVVAWREPTADVDLLVTDPKGELSDVGRPTSTGLVKERDCPGRHDDCHGKNYENVYLDRDEEPKHGTYKVGIRLESLRDEDVPIRVTLGARVGPKVYAAEIELNAIEDKAELEFKL